MSGKPDASRVTARIADAGRVTARIEILTPVPPLVDWLGIYWLYKTTPEKKKFLPGASGSYRETETFAVFLDSGRRNLMRVSNCMLPERLLKLAVDGGRLSSCIPARNKRQVN